MIAKLARDWYGKNENTDWIAKHGCRTLLKKGNRDVRGIFGLADADGISIDGFALGASSISIGEDLTFSFAVSTNDTTKVRLEYAIEYVRLHGKRSRKIFQIAGIA